MRLELFEIVQGSLATIALSAALFAALFVCEWARNLRRERSRRKKSHSAARKTTQDGASAPA
ncbi:MAG TPA: hypothetical protein VG843_05230 [Rhizomicrobium sp.]|jgi:hypothetical protein|nr:hypothetical protein [Rhizomicrobium sp.]